MKNKVLNKIKELIPLIIFLGIIAALCYSIYYSTKLEEQIWERDRTIQELSFRSKLVEDYFDIKYNPDDSTTSYILKDSIKDRFTTIQTEYKYIEVDQETRIRQGDALLTLDDLIIKYNALLGERNDIIQKYNSLVNETNTIAKENREIKEEKRGLNTALQLIEKRYKISYNISVDSNMIITSLKNTEMVDSALMILPYYRDKIERELDGTWIITR